MAKKKQATLIPLEPKAAPKKKKKRTKFAVGDKVRIVNYNSTFEWYGKTYKLGGKSGHVSGVSAGATVIYQVNIEGNVWSFYENQLAPDRGRGDWQHESI